MLIATATVIGTAILLPATASGQEAASAHPVAARPIPASAGHILAGSLAFPPTTAYCEQNLGIACYSPNQIRTAYNLAPLYKVGDTGKGRTIAIVDAFGSPTIAGDLKVFDDTYGLPAPPSLKVISPAGAVPAFDPTNSDVVGWAEETTLDVEYAHSIAPGANILLVTTPVSETEGVQGFPEIVKAENYVIDHNLADVITQSFGATEETFPTRQSLLDLRSAFLNAAAHHVSVLASSGDDGATNADLDGNLYPQPVNSWPSSDPLVTSIGGTQLFLDADGHHTSPDVVWNDGYGAGGGGLSSIFARPSFQNQVKSVVGSHRGTPDISMSAAVDGGVVVYYSFGGAPVGYHIFGGTSEASPIFSGIVALTTQLAHGKIGDINPLLYGLGRIPQHAGLVDVTSGDNSFEGVTGYPALKGYDLASGWGTINAAQFVPALALGSALLGRFGVH